MNTQETKKKKKERRPPQREIALASKSRERKPTLMKNRQKNLSKKAPQFDVDIYFFKNNILSLLLLLYESALHRIPRTTRGEEEARKIRASFALHPSLLSQTIFSTPLTPPSRLFSDPPTTRSHSTTTTREILSPLTTTTISTTRMLPRNDARWCLEPPPPR